MSPVGRKPFLGVSELTAHTATKIKQEAWISGTRDMSLVVRKPAFGLCENKDADQLRGNRKADQRLCFRYTDSTIPLLPKF